MVGGWLATHARTPTPPSDMITNTGAIKSVSSTAPVDRTKAVIFFRSYLMKTLTYLSASFGADNKPRDQGKELTNRSRKNGKNEKKRIMRWDGSRQMARFDVAFYLCLLHAGRQ